MEKDLNLQRLDVMMLAAGEMSVKIAEKKHGPLSPAQAAAYREAGRAVIAMAYGHVPSFIRITNDGGGEVRLDDAAEGTPPIGLVIN